MKPMRIVQQKEIRVQLMGVTKLILSNIKPIIFVNIVGFIFLY